MQCLIQEPLQSSSYTGATGVRRLDVFDKIGTADPAIVRPNGDLVKCMDDMQSGFQVQAIQSQHEVAAMIDMS